MAKKTQVRKNSRAVRRQGPEEEEDIELDHSAEELDSRSRVLQEIAEKKLREGGGDKPEGIEDELTAISRGRHPDQTSKLNSPNSRVGKNVKKSNRNKKKQERAEMVKDMLNEKIDLAKKRHKIVRGYRDDEEKDNE